MMETHYCKSGEVVADVIGSEGGSVSKRVLSNLFIEVNMMAADLAICGFDVFLVCRQLSSRRP